MWQMQLVKKEEKNGHHSLGKNSHEKKKNNSHDSTEVFFLPSNLFLRHFSNTEITQSVQFSLLVYFLILFFTQGILPLGSSSSLECDQTKTAHRSPGRNRQTRAGDRSSHDHRGQSPPDLELSIPKPECLPPPHRPALLGMSRFTLVSDRSHSAVSQSSPTWLIPFGWLADKWFCMKNLENVKPCPERLKSHLSQVTEHPG